MSTGVVDVPLVRLIVLPEKYHSVHIRTIGFVRIAFEGNVLYPHQDDYDNHLLGNGVWIELTDTIHRQEKQLNLKYCLVEGIFDAKRHGHMGAWSGTMKTITRFELWSDPAKPRR